MTPTRHARRLCKGRETGFCGTLWNICSGVSVEFRCLGFTGEILRYWFFLCEFLIRPSESRTADIKKEGLSASFFLLLACCVPREHNEFHFFFFPPLAGTFFSQSRFTYYFLAHIIETIKPHAVTDGYKPRQASSSLQQNYSTETGEGCRKDWLWAHPKLY